MKAKEGVLDYLNRILTNDLTAINQYFMHSEMCKHWGFERLYGKFREMSMDEMRDVERLMRHILLLDGLPNLQRLGTVAVGESVEEDLRLNLQQELGSAATVAEAIAHCERVEDFATSGMLQELAMHQSEDIGWLETQIETIRQVGIENYLSQQMHD